MGIRYDGLFKKLEENNMTKTGLQRSLKISSTTLAKLAKNEYVSMKVIDDICTLLDCQPSDIMEYVPANTAENRLIRKFRSEKRNKIVDGIYAKLQVNSVLASNINVNFSYEQLREMYESNNINTNNKSVSIGEIIAIVNYFRCVDYVVEHVREPITIEQIRIMFRILTNNTYLNRKIIKLEPEFIVADKKFGLDNILRLYEASEDKSLDTLLKFYHELMNYSPLVKKNFEMFGLLCLKESLRHGIRPFYVNRDIETGVFSSYDKLYKSVRESQDKFDLLLETV